MGLGGRLMRLYFDRVYNPVYDFTTAKTSSYQRLQAACVDKLELESGDRLLCVGVGTGNEILRLAERDNGLSSIIGADTSLSALSRAYRKASRAGARIDLFKMDAHDLGFSDGSFDKAFCHHLMGFLGDDERATREILRVLRSGGQFVVTYPAGSGGLRLLSEVGRSILCSLRSGRCRRAVAEFLAIIGAAIVNVPIAFWVRPKHGFYSYHDLEKLFTDLKLAELQIEEDSVYQDFIVYGRKS